MRRVTRETTILGGLPVMVTVVFGWDEFLHEGWSEVEEIRWIGRNGKKGKVVSEKIRDRAKKFDPCFADLTQRISEDLACEVAEERREDVTDNFI